MRSGVLVLAAVSASLVAACSSSGSPSSASAPASLGDPSDVPLDGVTSEQATAFSDGDTLFDTSFRAPDGLGPLYTRDACGGCHDSAARGPGFVNKMVVVEADGITPSADQTTLLPWGNTEHPYVAGGEVTPVLPPANAPSVKVTMRVGPPVFGRGYMEAILDAEIARVESEQAARTDAIHGRANRLPFGSETSADPAFDPHTKGQIVIGRFGLKARVPTLDDFTADALQGDMGITSPMRPVEIPNPDHRADDDKPGVDVTLEHISKVATYVRLIAIPRRSGLTDQGRALFDATKCSACHVPSMKTRSDYPIALLAGIDAPVYSDLLLHDLGDALADAMTDGDAHPRDWRTAPLMGLRFNRAFLHDGRAHSIDEAISLHAGEASESVSLYQHLSDTDRAALLAFVGAL